MPVPERVVGYQVTAGPEVLHESVVVFRILSLLSVQEDHIELKTKFRHYPEGVADMEPYAVAER